jgi:hypothetical protein
MQRWMLGPAFSAAVLAIIGCQSVQETKSAAGIPLGQGSQGPAVTGKASEATEQIVKLGDNQKTCEELTAEINGPEQAPPAGSNNIDVAGNSASSYLGSASSLLGSGAGLLSSGVGAALLGAVPIVGQVASSAMQALATNRSIDGQKAAMDMNDMRAAQAAAQRRAHLTSIFQEKKC